ncbi:FUSC family protein [Streptomyces niveus]|uniref:FUSC family protein n=1 Tax=Streptomyces niveus TaxID=193462 RepID=UPI0036CB1611
MRARGAERGWDVVRRAGQWLRRARDGAGDERRSLLLTAKSAVAATVAWMLAYYLLDARSPAFAPFSAVLLMHVTIYRCLAQALRYVGAVTAGVLVQAGLVYLGGPDLFTFILALTALLIGRWPALGPQGTQVATAAFFAFSTYTAAGDERDTALQLGQIILLVVIGSVVALVVNAVIAPPLRYRGAEHGIHLLADAMTDILEDIAPVLAGGRADREHTARWRSRAEGIGANIDQARAGLRTAEESLLYNPLRLFGRTRTRAHTHATFHGYAARVVGAGACAVSTGLADADAGPVAPGGAGPRSASPQYAETGRECARRGRGARRESRNRRERPRLVVLPTEAFRHGKAVGGWQHLIK